MLRNGSFSINPVLSETLSLIWGIFFFLCSYYFVHLLSSPKISLVKRSFFIQEFVFYIPLSFSLLCSILEGLLNWIFSLSEMLFNYIHSAFGSVEFLISVITILISKVCLSFFCVCGHVLPFLYFLRILIILKS